MWHAYHQDNEIRDRVWQFRSCLHVLEESNLQVDEIDEVALVCNQFEFDTFSSKIG